ETTYRLARACLHFTEMLRSRLRESCARLIHPKRKLEDMQLRVDEQVQRLMAALERSLRNAREQKEWLVHRLHVSGPKQQAEKLKEMIELRRRLLCQSMNTHLRQSRAAFNVTSGTLEALSPVRILDRGYSITRTVPDRSVIRQARQVVKQQQVEVMLAKGRLLCRVEDMYDHEQTEL
ncbi:exodeoxyribonuclease VII large subunit, partial [Thermodesulfobacteriota bacterium]